MRRLFSKKSADEGKAAKNADKKSSKEQNLKRTFFGKSHNSTANNDLQISHPTLKVQIDSSSSSALSIPTDTDRPSASSSSSSITRVTDSPISASVSPVPSLSRSPGSSQTPSSNSSSSSRPTSSSSKVNGNNGSNNSRKTPSPLSTHTNAHNLPTPPPSPSPGSNGRHDDHHPKRLNSIYNLFRKAQSQPHLALSAPSSQNNSTTTLPSTCMAPHMLNVDLVPPAPLSRRRSKVLRKKSSNDSLVEQSSLVSTDDRVLSANPNVAHRAILMGDPLGGGPYLYPTTKKVTPAPPVVDRSSRAARRNSYARHGPNNYSQEWRRNSWSGPPNMGGGTTWRKPRINRMIIEEEQGDSGEYQRGSQESVSVMRGGYIEDAPSFNHGSHNDSGSYIRRSSSNYGYFHPPPPRPAHYPPFAPPAVLPPISQFLEPPFPTLRV